MKVRDVHDGKSNLWQRHAVSFTVRSY